jgi:hypothetical protein
MKANMSKQMSLFLYLNIDLDIKSVELEQTPWHY